MSTQLTTFTHHHRHHNTTTPYTSISSNDGKTRRWCNGNNFDGQVSLLFNKKSSSGIGSKGQVRGRVVAFSSHLNSPNVFWDSWKPETPPSSSSLAFSDIFWPSAGAFAAMAIFGKMDQLLAAKGISISIAPLGAVSAVLFITPSSPAARKYNMFMAQIGCAAIGVLALSIFGVGWLARSVALAASVAFMISTRSAHPPAASLPLLFIDGAKFHRLNFWFALFPGAAGCLVLCLIVIEFSPHFLFDAKLLDDSFSFPVLGVPKYISI